MNLAVEGRSPAARVEGPCMRANRGLAVRLGMIAVLLAGASFATAAQAAYPPVTRLTVKHGGNGGVVGSANWLVTKPVSVRIGYDGNSPVRPLATLGKNYAGIVIEDARGKSTGGSVFFAGAHDRLGDPMPADLDVADGRPIHLKPGRYRIVFFTDAPSTLSFSLEGSGARSQTLNSWKPARDYKVGWAAIGPLGLGVIAVQQDLPVQLRKSTYGQFLIYSNATGASAQDTTACLLPREQRGTCSPLGINNEFGGGGEGDCARGGSCFGYLAGRFWGTPPGPGPYPKRTPGAYDIEFTHRTVGPVTTAGAFTLIKN